MISYKPDVIISVTASPQIEFARRKVQEIYEGHGVDCMVTSGCEGRHMVGSKHTTFRRVGPLRGVFDAHDFSVIGLNAKGISPAAVANEIRAALGRDYDVLVETVNTTGASGAHIHVEFDPKR